MTNLEYNGVLLKNVLTQVFDQSPVSDPSGTDIWYWEFTIRVSTDIYDTVYPPSDQEHGVVVIGENDGTSDVATRETAIRARLQQFRGNLKYSMNGVTLVEVNNSNNNADRMGDHNNGPKVTHLSVVRVSPRLLRIEFEVKAAVGCREGQGQGSSFPVVNNRWSCVDDIDVNYRSTRTWNGRLRMAFANRLPNNALSPHSFRGIITPPLARGFRRRSMRFMAEPNGLELAYDIVDEEIAGGAPPFPATKMSGMHTETIGIDATQSIGEFRLRLEAPKIVAKGDLISVAVSIGNHKLLVAAGSGTRHQMLQLGITDILADDVTAVEVYMRVRHIGLPADRLGGAVVKYIGQPFVLNLDDNPDTSEYDADIATRLSPFGTASAARSFACYLQGPCDTNNHSITTGSDASGGITISTDDGSGGTVTYSEVQKLAPFEPIEFSSGHEEKAYQFYSIDVVFNRNEHRVALPIALSGTAPRTNEPSAKLVSLARPGCKASVRITGERIGDWPELPKNKDFTDVINHIQYWVMRYKQNRRAPRLMPDGVNRLFVIDADIEYQLDRAPRDKEFSSANLPWDGTAGSDSRTNDDAFIEPEDYFL